MTAFVNIFQDKTFLTLDLSEIYETILCNLDKVQNQCSAINFEKCQLKCRLMRIEVKH